MRWWAPVQPALVPSQVELMLLEPGSDRRKDLGQFLLAAHRIGAAACEQVASDPIPDEASLVQTLAKARLAFAPPVVEAVSKSVGDRTHADLLVRDTLDDAESGALLVFRTCVSSGVPASIAAQRAGQVYGVPPQALGPYLSVAKELRAHPAVLADAADRVLFDTVAELVDHQMAQVYEEVSKAPAVLDRVETPYYDARDLKGRFAKPASASITELLATPVGAKAEAPAVRQARTKRVQRVKRVQRAKTKVEQARLGQAKVKAAPITRSNMTQAKVKAAVLEAFNQPSPPSHGKEWADDLLAKVETRYDYTRLLDRGEMRIVMNSADHRGLLDRVSDDETQRFFRIGHLRDKLGPGYVNKPGADHDQRIDELSNHFFAETGLSGPATKVIPSDEIADAAARGGPAEVDTLIEGVAIEMAKDYANTYLKYPKGSAEWREAVENEFDQIMAGEHYDADDNRVLVHEHAYSRRAPLVEFVIDAWDVRASHGPDTPGDVDLDPNQVYKIVPTSPVPRIDHRYGAAIRSYRLLPMSEDEQEAYGIEKAAATLDRVETPYYDARDLRGRFTAAPVSVTEALAQRAQPRTKRVARTKRTVRETASLTQARVQASRLKQATLQQAQVKVAQLQAAALKTAAAPTNPGPGYVELRNEFAYNVLTPEELSAALGQQSEGQPLDRKVVNHLMERVTSGAFVHSDLFDMAEINDESEPEWEVVKSPYPVTMLREVVPGADSLTFEVDEHAVKVNSQALRALASAFFEQYPDAQAVRLQKMGENEPVQVLRDLRDFTSFTRAEPIVLIEQQEGFDKTKPAMLVPALELPKNRLIPVEGRGEWMEVDSPDFGFHEENGPVVASHPAIARNPKVRMYRLINE